MGIIPHVLTGVGAFIRGIICQLQHKRGDFDDASPRLSLQRLTDHFMDDIQEGTIG